MLLKALLNLCVLRRILGLHAECARSWQQRRGGPIVADTHSDNIKLQANCNQAKNVLFYILLLKTPWRAAVKFRVILRLLVINYLLNHLECFWLDVSLYNQYIHLCPLTCVAKKDDMGEIQLRTTSLRISVSSAGIKAYFKWLCFLGARVSHKVPWGPCVSFHCASHRRKHRKQQSSSW